MNKYTKFFIITTKKYVKRQQRVLIDCQTAMNYVLSKPYSSQWLSDQINTHNVYYSRALHLQTSPSKRHKSTLSQDKKTF